MTKDDLLSSARTLPDFTDSAAKEYEYKSETMVAKVNEIMLKRKDLNRLVGEGNVEMMKNNHHNHAQFIANILASFNAEVLVDSVLWVFRAYRAHGFAELYWSAQLSSWNVVLKEELSSETFSNVDALYQWMTINIPVFTKLTELDKES